MERNDVLPCPFCGEAGVPGYRGQPATEVFIGCANCQCSGPHIETPFSGDISWHEAIAAWNRRAPTTPAAARPEGQP